MKHKHYDMIVAKASNMDLIGLIKSKVTNRWEMLDSSCIPSFYEESEYFLCLPQHKEVCLHWLNGGEYQVNQLPPEKMISIEDTIIIGGWSKDHWFMSEAYTFRIKPKKEKVWIGVYGKHVTENHFGSKSEVEKHVGESPVYSNCSHSWWQFIEIEIEVTN